VAPGAGGTSASRGNRNGVVQRSAGAAEIAEGEFSANSPGNYPKRDVASLADNPSGQRGGAMFVPSKTGARPQEVRAQDLEMAVATPCQRIFHSML